MFKKLDCVCSTVTVEQFDLRPRRDTLYLSSKEKFSN